ncbi:MAG: hypothetical protein HY301_16215 [Verrucomicrobia bacterium]|nr:hypothetical protein [Verrucomicrobiota bacterium]
MKRQPYFPRLLGQRPEWYHNFALEILAVGPGLGFSTGELNPVVADALYLEYVTGPWLTAAREFGPVGTSMLKQLERGTGASALPTPVFAVPALPPASAPLPAVVAVTPGALDRLMAFVQAIKTKPGYTETIGLQLGIVGPEDTADNPLPTFTLELDHTGGATAVKIIFKKYGNPGVAVWGRRGGGAWELLGIDLSSPYLDARPLLAANTPEVREYRLQFFDGNAPTGDFTPVQSLSVAP